MRDPDILCIPFTGGTGVDIYIYIFNESGGKKTLNWIKNALSRKLILKFGGGIGRGYWNREGWDIGKFPMSKFF